MRARAIVLILVGAFGLAGSATAGTYSGGTGEPNDPYRIETPNDLNDIGNHPEDRDKHFILVNDINLAEYTGTQFNIIEDFTGSFDGNDHSVHNFSYYSPNADSIGIFRHLNGPNAIVMNLKIVDPNITARGFIGGLAGSVSNGGVLNNCAVQGGKISSSSSSATAYAIGGLTGAVDHGGTISNCYSTSDVNGIENIGGLIGEIDEDVVVSNSFATGTVRGLTNVGGLIGNNRGVVSQCSATGHVIGNTHTGGLIGYSRKTISFSYANGAVDGNEHTGGLVGYNEGGITQNGKSISNCFAAGSVNGGDYTGGLVGSNEGSISDSYSWGVVDGNTAGGFAGFNIGLVSYCYSSGRVTGDEYATGGFVGEDHANSYENCFWDKTINSSVQGAGHPICRDFPEYCLEPWPDPQGLFGKSTAEMQTESTFTDWDFVEIWNIGENQTYPYLRVYSAGDLNHDGVVDMRDFAILALHWLEGTEP